MYVVHIPIYVWAPCLKLPHGFLMHAWLSWDANSYRFPLSCMDRHLSISEKPNNSNDYALPERAVHEVRASPGKNRQSRRRRTEVDSLLDDGLMMQELNLAVSRWPKVLVSLSHKEKEDDFMIMKGTRLPQRPKRRSKEVEKLVMYVSPGAWLREVSLEKYEVREKRPAKRKPAGLKAMESMDSDSD
ncbi:hypothetical protein KP509_20G066900 [Ceratopteris richardii]|uniref:Uncharacterized protein n=1 Tax=Ceratopteris richardii TaxID=49495 RepID=A0A8T2SGT0_CERRI|nr:hypothetical protein KP509_20G066900 [Ceratopteris richardii]